MLAPRWPEPVHSGREYRQVSTDEYPLPSAACFGPARLLREREKLTRGVALHAEIRPEPGGKSRVHALNRDGVEARIAARSMVYNENFSL